MFRGAPFKLVSSQIVGEDAKHADIVVSPYPTAHRGVLATFEVAAPIAPTQG